MAETSNETVETTETILQKPKARNYMPDVNQKKDESGSKPEKEKKKGKFGQLIQKFNERREQNSVKYKRFNMIMMILFPLYITFITELIHSKKITKMCSFFIDHPSVLLFDIIIAAIVFIFFVALFNKGWLAMFLESILFVTLSVVELFKYNTNGNHLILSDLRLAKNVKSLTSFAYIKITLPLVLCVLFVFLVFGALFFINPKIKFRPLHRVAIALACIVFGTAMVTFPKFNKPVYKLFRVDATNATNAFLLNEKFDNDGLIAFLVQTSTESYNNRLRKPDNYNRDNINRILNVKPDTSGDFNDGKKPNVIYIMSESYADFRVFDQLSVDDSYYKYFDKAREEGHAGTLITPTYASWTVRAEFELMFGLPVKGLNDPNMPQRVLAEHSLPAQARYYSSWGYKTAYVHPFQITFYTRDKIYGRFGFDDMIYHDDSIDESKFTVDVDHYGTYVDDKSVYNQLIDLIKTTDEPMYIHTTTMQNHQPYDQGEDPSDEFGNYLQWIQHSNEGLEEFLEELKTIDEPTLVFFVGDHFPSLRGETSVYNELDINGENCDILYEQKCFYWANYDADFSVVPEEKYSFFYVPYVIFKIIDAPHDSFIEKMLQYLDRMPIYSTAYNDEIPDNEDLDMLTYDRAVGNDYSGEDLIEATD